MPEQQRPRIEAATVTLEDEVPVSGPLPDTEYWLENYAWHAYDATRHVGFFMHIGRWSLDPTIWRELIMVFLPEGKVVVNRSFGAGDTSRGPSGALLRFTCEQPGKLWRISYAGPARQSELATMLAGALPDFIPDRLVIDVEWAGESPVLMYPRTNDETWGRWHYEQTGSVSGTISLNGTEYRLEGGFGYRDHSRGPRELSHHGGSSWIHGRFPDGTAFSVFEVWQSREGREYRALSEAMLIHDSGPEYVEIIESPPRMRSLDSAVDPIRIELRKSDGTPLVIEGEILNSVAFSLSARFEWLYGNDGVQPLFGLEQPARFVCGDKVLDGYIERSFHA